MNVDLKDFMENEGANVSLETPSTYDRILSIRDSYLDRTLSLWRGQERLFLIELVRSLDAAAFTVTQTRDENLSAETLNIGRLMLVGAASALRPFVGAIEGTEGGVPWGPSDTSREQLANQHLLCCGYLSHVLRLVGLERYGLARTSFRSPDRMLVEVGVDQVDAEERSVGGWLADTIRTKHADELTRLSRRSRQIHKRMDRYTGKAWDWFIRYDPDAGAREHYRRLAAIHCAGTPEAEALPPDAVIGGRPFSEWLDASVTALGKVLHHLACAKRLVARHPELDYRNLMTVFSRKEDIQEVWLSSDSTDAQTRMPSALLMDRKLATACEEDHEIPLPYYVDFGRDFVLLPSFGSFLNPIAGLTWYLRRTYREDWDRAVEGRERVFREDIRQLFHQDRFFMPPGGFKVKRPDGSHITDVDAAILDRKSGQLLLIQLKWPDIHGRSLAER